MNEVNYLEFSQIELKKVIILYSSKRIRGIVKHQLW